jgi:hypothetical protein
MIGGSNFLLIDRSFHSWTAMHSGTSLHYCRKYASSNIENGRARYNMLLTRVAALHLGVPTAEFVIAPAINADKGLMVSLCTESQLIFASIVHVICSPPRIHRAIPTAPAIFNREDCKKKEMKNLSLTVRIAWFPNVHKKR